MSDDEVPEQVDIIFAYTKDIFQGLTLHPDLSQLLHLLGGYKTDQKVAKAIILSGIVMGQILAQVQSDKVKGQEPISPMDWQPDMNPPE